MSGETLELVRICEQLPDSKRGAVTDFARFLLAQQDDQRWEELLASPLPRPKLDSLLRESAAESATPLDRERL